jgi:hypothetical protein
VAFTSLSHSARGDRAGHYAGTIVPPRLVARSREARSTAGLVALTFRRRLPVGGAPAAPAIGGQVHTPPFAVRSASESEFPYWWDRSPS